MRQFKEYITERLVLSKNKYNYTIDDITPKELYDLLQDYANKHGVFIGHSSIERIDLHDIYGPDDDNLPICKEENNNIKIGYVIGKKYRNEYGIDAECIPHGTCYRYGINELIGFFGEDDLVKIYSFLKDKQNK